ncbi:hypothetical protein Slu03_07830 [Sediminihabitans luteus]|uniref:helix-turn-helix domain-containing protein n=1 Tax=Sediminihabitans luteus TaxID=1138585 RepID=UPI000C2452C9|nr:helix-turn-helix transcriptional regulator [Sediminihabitans luteus]GII98405.1 hypothetical protein Slu03_07830 [Sediminihabitans luteus]
MENMLDDEFLTPQARLAMELAREDQQLIVRLVEYRERAGISQAALAELMGLSQPTISAFERIGNDPRLSTVRRYARALGVMVRHLVDVDTECGDSHFIAHVSDRGVSQHETAAAIRRGISRPPITPRNWSSIEPDRARAFAKVAR